MQFTLRGLFLLTLWAALVCFYYGYRPGHSTCLTWQSDVGVHTPKAAGPGIPRWYSLIEFDQIPRPFSGLAFRGQPVTNEQPDQDWDRFDILYGQGHIQVTQRAGVLLVLYYDTEITASPTGLTTFRIEPRQPRLVMDGYSLICQDLLVGMVALAGLVWLLWRATLAAAKSEAGRTCHRVDSTECKALQ